MDGSVPRERQRGMANLSSRAKSDALSARSGELMVWRSKSACGSKEFNSPFPVSPSGGKPGRAGSPHAESMLLASKGGWQASMLPAPPTRGLPPPCGSPASAVVLQIVVSIKPELSIWLKTGTFYLALTGMSRWTVSSAPPFCTGEPLRLIDRLEQWIFRSVLHDIGGNTKWSYRGELQLRIESKTLSKAQSVPSAPLR